MGGMQAPPSILTIDHSASNNWHSEGDGAVEGENDNPDDFSDSEVIGQSRSIEIAGRESSIAHSIPFDDPHAMQILYTSMERKLTSLENGLEYQNRVSNWWRYLLLSLTILNPFIITYLLSNRRR